MKHLLTTIAIIICCLCILPSSWADVGSGMYHIYIFRLRWVPLEYACPVEGDFVAISSATGARTFVCKYPSDGLCIMNIKEHNEYSVMYINSMPISAHCKSRVAIARCIKKYPYLDFICLSFLGGYEYTKNNSCPAKRTKFVTFGVDIKTRNASGGLIFPAIGVDRFPSIDAMHAYNVICLDIAKEGDIEKVASACTDSCKSAVIRFRIPIKKYEAQIRDF